MKKRRIKNLSLSKKTISKLKDVHHIAGGGVSVVIICLEEFTEGCSPSFLRQCPRTKHTFPQYCW